MVNSNGSPLQVKFDFTMQRIKNNIFHTGKEIEEEKNRRFVLSGGLK